MLDVWLKKKLELHNEQKKTSSRNGAGLTGCWHVEECEYVYISHSAQN